MERRVHYLFVDLEYLREQYRSFAERWFQGEGGLDYAALYRHAHVPAKTFYYDAGDGRDADRIRAAPGAHLRTGDPTAAPSGRQKAVAVQLAVDVLQHATRGKMTNATLLTGDPDFAPVVRALVDAGADVTVWAQAGSVAPALRTAADHFLPIRWQDHHHWTDERIGASALLPGIGSGVATRLEGSRESHLRNGWSLLESGSIGEARHRADLWGIDGAEGKRYSLAIEHAEGPEPTNVMTVSHSDLGLLRRYADIEWGAVNLAPPQGS